MADNSDQILHFHEYFKVIRNRLWVIFTIFTLTVHSGYYVTNEVLQKTYSATSEIKILPRELTPIPTTTSGHTQGEIGPQEFQNEFEVITSPDVLSPIVTDLHRSADHVANSRECRTNPICRCCSGTSARSWVTRPWRWYSPSVGC